MVQSRGSAAIFAPRTLARVAAAAATGAVFVNASCGDPALAYISMGACVS